MKKALLWIAAVVVVGGLVFVGLRGCTAMPWNRTTSSSGAVSVTITRDFGRVLLKRGTARPGSGGTAMDATKAVADVKTDYGSGFVSEIYSLKSNSGGVRKDWFYYVNGVLSGVGADQMRVKAGDKVWWDYHQWNGGSYAPEAVGAYPAPFSRGYPGGGGTTTIVYGTGAESVAREVGTFLQKSGATVSYSSDVGSLKPGHAPAMAFLSFEEAMRTGWVSSIMKDGGGTGAFVTFEGGKLVPLDASGKEAPTGNAITAAIVSTGSGMGDGSSTWLVLCDGQKGLEQAAGMLLSEASQLKNKIGVAVDSSGAIYPLPR
jgi:hypothetical protein